MKVRNVIMGLFVACGMALLLTITACSGSGSAASGSGAKTYSWDGATFTVKEITDDESVVADHKDKMSGKCVAVVTEFEKEQPSMNDLTTNIVGGNILLDGEKPTQMNFEIKAGDEEGCEVTFYFDMDKDYTINEQDLVIKG